MTPENFLTPWLHKKTARHRRSTFKSLLVAAGPRCALHGVEGTAPVSPSPGGEGRGEGGRESTGEIRQRRFSSPQYGPESVGLERRSFPVPARALFVGVGDLQDNRLAERFAEQLQADGQPG